MKKHLSLLLAGVLVLSCTGCAWMEGSYQAIRPHQVGYSRDDGDMDLISSYSELRTAVTAMIDTGMEEAVFTLYDYPEEDLNRDMESLIRYATESYPVGAWAVSEITYEYGQYLLSVQISYRRSKTDIDRIYTVRGINGAKEAINTALTACESSIVLQVTGYKDTDFVQYVADYAGLHPDTVMELPQVTAQSFPQSGTVRILELQFTYQTSRESLRQMQSQVRPVFSSARLYVSSDTNDGVKLSQLYSFLMERFDYVLQTSITPSYSLLLHGVGDSRSFAQVYAAMCRQTGVEAMTVSGTRNGESRFWNIVRNGDVWYHVDLLECARLGYFQQLSDEQMWNYVWDYSAYPACGVDLAEETVPENPPEKEPSATTEPPETATPPAATEPSVPETVPEPSTAPTEEPTEPVPTATEPPSTTN